MPKPPKNLCQVLDFKNIWEYLGSSIFFQLSTFKKKINIPFSVSRKPVELSSEMLLVILSRLSFNELRPVVLLEDLGPVVSELQ